MEQNYQNWLSNVAANLAVDTEDMQHLDHDLRYLYCIGVNSFDASQKLIK